MDRQNAIGYIGSVSWRGSRLGLERMEELLHAMGNPQEKLRFVHVAGTNGKGSICTMLASVLVEAGYRTGLYTSPFVGCFNERIQVNRSQITDEDLTRLTAEVRRYADAMEDHPTEFEIVTALGFLYFVEKQCDIVILEVGLGGRLDATNAIPAPLLAVITSIGLDHIQELGKNIGKITEEKAGIIKQGTEVVASPHPPVAEEKVEEACRRHGVPLHKTNMARLTPGQADLSGQRFVWDGRLELEMPLAGMYQLVNAATALTALEVLGRKDFPADEEAIKRGFLAARWPARLELLRQKPVFFLDGGHNLQGAQVLMQSLRAFYPERKWVFLTGVMGDKNWRAMMKEALGLAERFICVAPEMERALGTEELAAGIRELDETKTIPVQTCESVCAGVKAALEAAGEDGLACAFGSLYMAGEIREYFGFGIHHREDFF